MNSTASESSSRIGDASGTYFKDASKPDGDTCHEDGTLKDASEMEWPDSPSEPNFQEDLESALSYLSNGKKKKEATFLRRRRLGHNNDGLTGRRQNG